MGVMINSMIGRSCPPHCILLGVTAVSVSSPASVKWHNQTMITASAEHVGLPTGIRAARMSDSWCLEATNSRPKVATPPWQPGCWLCSWRLVKCEKQGGQGDSASVCFRSA